MPYNGRQYTKHRERYYTVGTGNEFTVAIDEIIRGYEGALQYAANNAFNEISKECVQKLRQTSPKNYGDYAKAWHVKKRTDNKRVTDYVVYNDLYRLTHLLENSHIISNGSGEYGRTRPGHGQVVHIKPVSDWANAEIVRRIEEDIEKI